MGTTISISGSGGKTTLLLLLAKELYAAHSRVIVSTTTHIRRPPMAPLPDVLPPGPFLYHLLGPQVEEDKYSAPPMERLRELASQCDYLLLETDGARGHSWKIYREGEPVLPPWPHESIVVVGLDGGPIYRSLEHDPSVPRMAELLRVYLGRVERPHLVLNKVSDRGVALGLLASAPRVQSAWLRRPDGPLERISQVTAILLAGGQSTRMGRFKLLELLEGKPLIQHSLDALLAADVDQVVVVTGHREADLKAAIVVLDPRIHFVSNPDYAKGMSTSIVAALRAMTPSEAPRAEDRAMAPHLDVLSAVRRVPDSLKDVVVQDPGLVRAAVQLAGGPSGPPGGTPLQDAAQILEALASEGVKPIRDAARILVALGDMPAIRASTIKRLCQEPADIVAPSHHGRRGHPVLIARRYREEMLELTGDRGAAPILQKHGVVEVEVDDPGVLMDVDTVQDLRRSGPETR